MGDIIEKLQHNDRHGALQAKKQQTPWPGKKRDGSEQRDIDCDIAHDPVGQQRARPLSAAAAFKCLRLGKLAGHGAREKMIKAFAKSGGCGIAACRRPTVMTVQMSDAKMAVKHAGQHRRSDPVLERIAAMHRLMRHQHAENPSGHACRQDKGDKARKRCCSGDGDGPADHPKL